MSPYHDPKASAGLVSGFLSMMALLLFLAAITIELGADAARETIVFARSVASSW